MATPGPSALFPVKEDNAEQLGMRDVMEEWIARDLQGEPLFEEFLESMPPSVLFHERCLASPLLYRKLRDLLLDRGVEVRKMRGLTIITALIELYPNPVDQNQARFMVNRSAGDAASSTSNPTQTSAPGPSGTFNRHGDRNGHRVATKYKDSSSKYSGAIGESWNDYSQAYLRYLQDCDIPMGEGAKYLHNLLKGETLRFLTHNAPFASLDQAIKAIEEEFNSRTRQNQVKNELAALRLPLLVGALGKSSRDCLEHIRSEISSKIYLCPEEYRTESHKRQCLRDAVVGLEWSRDPLSRAESGNWTFQKLFSELYASIGAYDEGILAMRKDKVQTRRTSGQALASAAQLPGTDAEPKSNPSILFNGQTKYALHPKRTFKHIHSHNRYKNAERRLCYNCKSPDHFIAHCDKPVSAMNAARRAFRKIKSSKDAKEAIINLAEQYGFMNDLSDSEDRQSNTSSESATEDERDTAINFIAAADDCEGAPAHIYESTLSSV